MLFLENLSLTKLFTPEIYILYPNAAMTYFLLNITKLKLLAFRICIFNVKIFTCHVDYEDLTF